MRVSGEQPRAADAARAAGRASFRDVLARAREAGPGPTRRVASRPLAAPPQRRDPVRPARTPAERPGDVRDAAKACPPPSPDAARPVGEVGAEGPAGAAALRAAIRALPVAVDAARVRAGGPLEIALGRALAVELRPVGAGVELVLRPAPALVRVASAELPALVRALRARGIAVARAEVRARGSASGRAAGARVDAAAGLR